MSDVTVTEGGNSAALLSELATELFHAERELARAEEAVESAKRRVEELSTRRLPELMDELDLTEYKTASGLEITIKNQIRASLSRARLADGIRWLEQHGLGRIVKREVRASLGKGEDALEQKLLEAIRENAPGVVVEATPNVNPQTLSAAVRELIETGQEVDMELLGVFHGRKTTVKLPK